MELYPEKTGGTPHHALRAVAIVIHCLHILTTCPTQEFVGQSRDQYQTFALGQTSPRQNKLLGAVMLSQWRSSAPKSGGDKLFFQKSEKQKKKKKKKVTAAFKRMIGYCE